MGPVVLGPAFPVRMGQEGDYRALPIRAVGCEANARP